MENNNVNNILFRVGASRDSVKKRNRFFAEGAQRNRLKITTIRLYSLRRQRRKRPEEKNRKRT